MKVFNLACSGDHRFEGWFGSAAAFDEQQTKRLIECPVCGSHEVVKMPAAPRLNLSQKPAEKGARSQIPSTAPGNAPSADGASGQPPPSPARVQAMFLQMVRQIMASTEDVGERFAEEARRIHYNEAPERAIRGSATPDEADALRDEGIEVVALPIPAGLKEPLQ